MSSQDTLASYTSLTAAPEPAEDTTHPQRTRPATAWRPRDERRCLRCGTLVDEVTRKVAGQGPNNEIDGCPECAEAFHALGEGVDR